MLLRKFITHDGRDAGSEGFLRSPPDAGYWLAQLPRTRHIKT